MNPTLDSVRQADLPVELAHRVTQGLDVLLLWDERDGRLIVVVDDAGTGASFALVATDGKDALDAFYHPFAYAADQGVAYSTLG